MSQDEGRAGGARGGAPAGQGRASGTAASGAESKAAGFLPALSLPKGGGAIRGMGEKFSTSPATGTGSLSVPIVTSPGRTGFELGLALSYDSGTGNGPFGLGWQLSTPSVTRKTDKGLPRYIEGEDPDVFVLSGAEDLVPVRVRAGASTCLDVFERGGHRVQRYRPRTEGLFARIERWTDTATGDVHWRAITRDNVLNIYGRSPLARIADPEDPGRVFSWLLEETRDDRGNLARYTYKAEDGAGVDPAQACESNHFETRADGSRFFRGAAQRYVKRIQYGNRVPVMDRDAPAPTGDNDYLFEAVFDYGEHSEATPTPAEERPWPVRQDAFSSYRATFEVRTYRLCRRVLMFHRFAELGPTPCLVRSTDFTYDEGPALTYLAVVTQAGYKRAPGGSAYERDTLPPLELGYAKPTLHDEPRTVDAESLAAIPGGVPGAGAQWVDLDGEGIPGILVPTESAWLYKANQGHGRFAHPVPLRSIPSPAELSGGAQQLVDIEGNGRLDLVQYAPPLSGYFERTPEGGWAPFRPLRNLPDLDWNDPNLRLLDLDGDGHADVLITENDAFVWYRSRAKEGFEPAVSITKPRDELKGPAIVFADGTETLHLADMSGDGLVDIVRVRNGQVCYWPNLGHGRFGRRVTLDNSPVFDAPAKFDPKRIRFADIDGSGTSDIVYLGREGVRLYFNQSGNRFSAPTRLQSLPPVDSLSSLGVVDLLGQGTACLVWSSPLPGHATRPLVYVDLMGGKKPHLLVSLVNNLGAETRISYAPSTKFYLQDKSDGRPWLTRLAFPVHVVERIERYDHVAHSKLVTRYRYHHGYFDGHEREFRGFACVEQLDAESFHGSNGQGLFPESPYDASTGDEQLQVAPVRTVTWLHTGAWLERERLELALAKEYYGGDPQAPLLRDTQLPEGLSIREEREAARALRGQVLRQEVYAEDGTPEAIHPYTVSERDYEVRLLQHAEQKAHAVFFIHPRQTLTLHYERKPKDPRVLHEAVLTVDDFGNVTQSVKLAYPRRAPQEPEQARSWMILTESRFANRPEEASWFRVGIPIEATTSELTGLAMPAQGLLALEALRAALMEAAEIPYEAKAKGTSVERRAVERERRLYYRNDLSGPMPLGQVESLSLLYETYRQASTPGLIMQVYGSRVPDAILEREGHYVQQDGAWWAPSGRGIFDPERFYLPVAAIDPFGQHHRVRYDAYALLSVETEDPLHNRVTAGLRDAAGNITQPGLDYRVLAPALVTDANRNRAAVEFDALGRVVKTALMGKQGAGEGDTLEAPTAKIEYNPHCWRTNRRPVFVHTLVREQHGSAHTRWQETYAYSDGSGREAMKKVQAEPGPVPVIDTHGRIVRNPDGTPRTLHVGSRWVGTGRTIFDNKGNPVKKYEPFFSATFAYEDEAEVVEWGVTPILRYDPLGRLVRTDQPNGTYSRVIFDAWRQESWDENDSVAGTRWLAQRQAGTSAEQRSARLTLAHAGTPTVAHLDALGRVFLTVADNGAGQQHPTRVELDVEGNPRSIIDARGDRTLVHLFDVLGRTVYTLGADAGESRVLLDVGNKPVRAWEPRGFVTRRVYDAAQRPSHSFVRQGEGAEKLVERTVYGEAHPEAEARNLRTHVYEIYDGAGRLTNARLDFKGNLLESRRRLALEYRDAPDWMPLSFLSSVDELEAAANELLHTESFVTTSAYDALNRIVSRVTPDGSETRPSYNEANLLDKVDGRIRGSATWRSFVRNINYNARGQRERITYGNGAFTDYLYEEETFRLLRRVTRRASDNLTLQDVRYEYDPVGNITQTSDAVSFGNPAVSADGLYEYDPLYRLVSAEGREHPGQQPSADEPPLLRFDNSNDMQALGRYRERYVYDAVGNIQSITHRPSATGVSGWTRQYEYAPGSNRLSRTGAPGELSGQYSHDAAGNMTRMPHLPELRWDHAGRLQYASRQVRSGTEPVDHSCFTYDAVGQRLRKVYEHGGFIDERIFLGGYEVYRRRRLSDGALQQERQTLHLTDGQRRLFLLETETVDSGSSTGPGVTRSRLQLDNHLGSSVLELDEAAQVISYEEYHPFGSTAVRAAGSAVEVSAKRYRYTGKERDEETGLYYYGARYYAPWLGRWTSTDPKGISGGLNLYGFVENNPIRFQDFDGLQPQNSIDDLLTFLHAQAGFETGAAKPPTFDPKSASGFGTAAHARATAVLQEMKTIGYAGAERIYSEVRVIGGTITQIAGKPGGPKGAHNIDVAVAKAGQQLSVGQSISGGVAETLGDLKYGGGVMDQKYAVHGSPLQTITGRTQASASAIVADVARVEQTAVEAVKVEQAAVAAVSTAGKAEGALAAASKVIAPVAEALRPLAPVARVAGKVAGPVGAVAVAAQVATAKTTEQKVDAGISVVSTGLLMSKNPVAMAAGAGLATGQLIEHGLNVSEYASAHGVAAYEGLKKLGVNEDVSFVAGGVVSVVSTPVAIAEAATHKAADLAGRAWNWLSK
jgi:RHS repeat-associated protein